MRTGNNNRYNKEVIETEAKKSMAQGRITEPIGQFIIDRCEEISASIFSPPNQEYRQALVDYAVMHVCEKFLDKYKEGRSAANLIISMIHNAMIDRTRAAKWTDVYGQLNKEFVATVTAEGERKVVLMQTIKDDTVSRLLSGERLTDLL